MASVLISDLIPILQQPGLMPRMEEECQQLLQLFRAILPVLPVVVSRLNKKIYFAHEVGENEGWLRDLNAVAYEVDDIVYEFRYAKLRAEAETNGHHSDDKVRTSIFSLCKLISGMRERLPIKEGMKERLTGLVTRIRVLLETSTRFVSQDIQGLMPGAESREGPILSSLKEIDSIIVGRDEDKEQIVNWLLDSNFVGDTNTISVIPIVGGEGRGKTTLARFTCADIRIKDNFEVILWVDVGGEIDVPRIAKSVIDQVIGKDCCLSEGDSDLLQRRIYQELSGKRFLLVLNDVGGDVWDDVVGEQLKLKWEQLKSWLEQSAAIGSSLIVTTFWKSAASIMSSAGGCQMDIPSLRDGDFWTVFCKRAFFADEEISPGILEISRQILKKCHDLLEVNLMGGLMRFKKELAEWQQVIHQLNHSTSNSPIGLCIAHLSPETRECFAFCSVFPVGHYMDKEVLVKLWMANGLISSDRSTSVEEKGNHIFNELALRNFFEDVKLVPESSSRDKHGYRSRVICRLHTGMHRLAILFFRYRIISEPRPDRFLFVHGDSPSDIPVLLKNNPDVRILVYSNDSFIRTVKCGVLPNSNSLRALHLPSALFDRDLFELKYTKHLRYLDLSGSRIKRLPESTSSLYFIQTLNLSKCLLLERLPEDMRYMSSLRHLHVDKCPKLKKMPIHLGQLSCLKILTAYIVGERAGNGIDELKCLNLSGLLEIYNLHNMKDATIAKEADLFSKTNLERLTLCWGRQQLVMSKGNNHSEVLEALQPHNGLKVLKIQQYGGNEFANWLTNPGLLNLVELHLIGCSQCSTIPPVWKIRSLRVLCLKYMINLTCMYNFEFTSFPGIDKKDGSELFPSLKRLVLVGLKKLERWHGEEGMQRTIPSFPVLDEMEITNCPELKSMPSVPVLKYLTISIENHGLLQSTIDLITLSQSLVEVSMAKATESDNVALLALDTEVKGRNIHKLRVMRLESTNSFFMARAIPHLRLGFWRSLVSLENLDIFNCSSIFAWPLEEFRNLRKLKRLSFQKCPNLTGLPPNQLQKDEKILPLLQSLEFYACPSLKEVPRCTSILFLELDECPEINSISGLHNLKMVYLSCLNWTSLPTGFQDLKKLESLRVSECYCLECLPDELAGLTLLRTLIIDKCARVHCLPNYLGQMLSGLEKFQISKCPALEKFCEEGQYSSIISKIGTRRNNSTGPSTEVSSSSAGPA